jgi:hypothetical protein
MSTTKKLQFTLALDPILQRDWDTLEQEYDILDNASKVRLAISQAAKSIRKSKVKRVVPTLSDEEKVLLNSINLEEWSSDEINITKEKSDNEAEMFDFWNNVLKK